MGEMTEDKYRQASEGDGEGRSCPEMTECSVEQVKTGTTELDSRPLDSAQNLARYLYAVVSSPRREELGGIGVDGETVYTVPYRDIAAVVHRCPPRPYETKDEEIAGGWLLEHNYVIDQATARFGTVLPFSFDVIIRGGDEEVANWLSRSYSPLREQLSTLQDKAEYSIQIFCRTETILQEILAGDGVLRAMNERLSEMPSGRAYLQQRNLELKLKDRISAEVGRLAREFHLRMEDLVDDIKVDDRKSWVPDKYKGMKQIISLSCLVARDKVSPLGEVLDGINSRDGFAVRFTGPWAPFSFVRMEG
jgi:hypothetical protein